MVKVKTKFCVVILFVVALGCRDNNTAQTPLLPEPDSSVFRNPVLFSAPDPWVIQKDGWYYVTHTTGNSLRLYRTKDVSQLRMAESKTVWTAPDTGPNSRNVWAPELHFVDGKWYFYYAADDGQNENHKIFVLENANADPFIGTWTDRGELELPQDRWAIDGTAFQHNNQWYFAWSGWEGNVNVQQNIYIIRMASATSVSGDRVLLSRPTQPWEQQGGSPAVNEAPQFLSHGNKVFITYFASGCWTDDYSLGLLTADATDDLVDAAEWTKYTTPVFVKSQFAQAYGPGHNSFFKSPDGTEDWMIYHANASAGRGCGNERSARMQKIEWSAEGLPVFRNPVPLNENIKRPSGEDNN